MSKILSSAAADVQTTLTDQAPVESDTVGSRLRRMRKLYGMSQRELAKQAGVTNGAISVIEQDRVSPSVASLKKILEVFDLSLSEFFAADFTPDSRVFVRAADLTLISDGPVLLRQVGLNLANRKMQVLHETYPPGGDTGEVLLSHDGEEAGIVVRGEIEVTVGGQSQVLRRGDGYYFDSRLPHRFRNRGDEECELVSSCTPPSF
jgi:transcriptional regulator with XRE-family HTH domain